MKRTFSLNTSTNFSSRAHSSHSKTKSPAQIKTETNSHNFFRGAKKKDTLEHSLRIL